jgi:hypothetical protein
MPTFGHRGFSPPLVVGKRFVAAGKRFGEGFIIFGREPGCAGGRGTQSRATSRDSDATSGDICRCHER